MCCRKLVPGVRTVTEHDSIEKMISSALLTRMGCVDVLSWNPVRSTEGEAGSRLVNNFGDLIGPLLVERMVGDIASRGLESGPARVLVAVGSILHFAPPGSVVWGTGVNFKLATKLPLELNTIDFRAVRGPYSARAIAAGGAVAPRVFGDPALLLPRFMPELHQWSRTGSGELLVVPNLNDLEAMSAVARVHGYAVLDPRGPLRSVLRAIAESGFVVGSSLHAVVIADALGIPARFVASNAEGAFKYRDYLAGTGRPLAQIAPDVQTAVALGGHAATNIDLDALLEAFPRDLWGSARASALPASYEEHPSIIVAWRDLLSQPQPDEALLQREFRERVLPTVTAAGVEVLGDHVTEQAAMEARAVFDDSYAEAHSYRCALAAGLASADLLEQDRALLDALDTDDPNAFLRALWLRREGRHALLHAMHASDELRVLSIALRPGTISNDIVSIAVVCEDDTGGEHVVDVPVFAMYHRQWSIDLSASVDLPPRTRLAKLTIRATDAVGIVSDTPVIRAPIHVGSLTTYPQITGLPEWAEEEVA